MNIPPGARILALQEPDAAWIIDRDLHIVIGWRVAQTEYGGVIVIGCMALVALLLSDR